MTRKDVEDFVVEMKKDKRRMIGETEHEYKCRMMDSTRQMFEKSEYGITWLSIDQVDSSSSAKIYHSLLPDVWIKQLGPDDNDIKYDSSIFYYQRSTFKPHGMWASKGDWLYFDQFSGMKNGWLIKVDYTDILVLTDIDDVINFCREYSTEKHITAPIVGRMFKSHDINWKKVSMKYKGFVIAIPFDRLLYERDITCFNLFDVSSLCVWDLTCITSVHGMSFDHDIIRDHNPGYDEDTDDAREDEILKYMKIAADKIIDKIKLYQNNEVYVPKTGPLEEEIECLPELKTRILDKCISSDDLYYAPIVLPPDNRSKVWNDRIVYGPLIPNLKRDYISESSSLKELANLIKKNSTVVTFNNVLNQKIEPIVFVLLCLKYHPDVVDVRRKIRPFPSDVSNLLKKDEGVLKRICKRLGWKYTPSFFMSHPEQILPLKRSKKNKIYYSPEYAKYLKVFISNGVKKIEVYSYKTVATVNYTSSGIRRIRKYVMMSEHIDTLDTKELIDLINKDTPVFDPYDGYVVI